MQTYLIFSAEYRRWGQLTASFPDYDASPHKSLGMGLLLSVTKIYTRELLQQLGDIYSTKQLCQVEEHIIVTSMSPCSQAFPLPPSFRLLAVHILQGRHGNTAIEYALCTNLQQFKSLVLRGVFFFFSHFMAMVSALLYRFKDLVAEALKKLEAIKEERVKKVSRSQSLKPRPLQRAVTLQLPNCFQGMPLLYSVLKQALIYWVKIHVSPGGLLLASFPGHSQSFRK